MNFLRKLNDFFTKYMAILIVFVAGFALFFPCAVSFIQTSFINYLLMIIMFGMGLTLQARDFQLILQRPKDLIIGILAQFSIMPLVAFLLCFAFDVPAELALGIILVGACPGGTASNVMSYLAKGDLALSLSITSFSTFLAPLLTPIITLLYVGEEIEIDVISMIFSLVEIVIIPVLLGFIIKKFFYGFSVKIQSILPLISISSIMLIVACIVGVNSQKILQIGFFIFIIVVLHNVFGYILGYFVAKFFKMPFEKRKTLSIEVGMQNSALASSLAVTHFASMPLAAVPGAVFSVWHNISGSILANILALKK
ncbi:bile acid:sodium symporter family protein [Campylobacter sp. MIT 21-1685]|uniref:bile acid:sodium symporter family protein n=1 Tax=unclassified Campylobacter TaxID=2593542 RepID=UPI00224B379A|nr:MULTISPECIES: bile acid:sodium symporter family protein [unclassified Campylobacter]MCX2683632.1 bile acid:sodium symporter family protein [Campylobacter sp. MIT 21-1684]MCX2751915.1 bile acid:sodium symporter family protein [Campylobacter sp. MIT 21-1682]MCX2808116.1 bile acid:sodium symporter family protein [Campylobacter sp. MIT 21-1685]